MKDGENLIYDEGFLRVVPDKDFAKLKLSQLCSQKPVNKNGWKNNLFGEIRSWVPHIIKKAREAGYSFVPKAQREDEEPKLTEVDEAGKSLREKLHTREMSEAVGAIVDLVNLQPSERKFGKKSHVDQLTQGKRTSAQFTEMVKEVKKLHRLQQYLEKRFTENIPLNGQEYRKYYERVQAAMDRVAEKQDLYLARKRAQRGDALKGKNDYEQYRINYAKSVGNFVDRARHKFGGLPAPDELLADREEVRAHERQLELDERQAAMKALREIHEKANLPSPEKLREQRMAQSSLKNGENREEQNPEAPQESEGSREPQLGAL